MSIGTMNSYFCRLPLASGACRSWLLACGFCFCHPWVQVCRHRCILLVNSVLFDASHCVQRSPWRIFRCSLWLLLTGVQHVYKSLVTLGTRLRVEAFFFLCGSTLCQGPVLCMASSSSFVLSLLYLLCWKTISLQKPSVQESRRKGGRAKWRRLRELSGRLAWPQHGAQWGRPPRCELFVPAVFGWTRLISAQDTLLTVTVGFSSPKGGEGDAPVWMQCRPETKSTSNQREYSQRSDKCNSPRRNFAFNRKHDGEELKNGNKTATTISVHIRGGKQRINRPDIAHQIYNICTYI